MDRPIIGCVVLAIMAAIMLPACQPPTSGKTEEDLEGQSGGEPGGQKTPPQQTDQQRLAGWYHNIIPTLTDTITWRLIKMGD